MLGRYRYFIILLSGLLSCYYLNAQLHRGSANFADVSEYEYEGVNDSLFIFYAENGEPYIEATSINPNDTIFSWSIYNPSTGFFDASSVNTGTFSRRYPDPEAGSICYQVEISGSGNDSIARCWVLFNDFDVEITSTDEEGNIPHSVITCGRIKEVKAEIDSANMNYTDLNTGDDIYYENDYNDISWTNSDEEATVIPSSRLIRSIRNPHWRDSYYIITITDGTGLVRDDSAYYESVEPNAWMDYRHIKLNEEAYYPDRSEIYYEIYGDEERTDEISAPAMYMFFSNEVENADSVKYFFGDSTSLGSAPDSLTHTYMLPGTYVPYIVAYHQADYIYDACTDTFRIEESEELEPIEVDEPKIVPESGDAADGGIQMRNWFTPPNGEPKYFRFHDISIGRFEIAIYNRYGKRVHHFEGDIRDWEGWDGRYKDTDDIVSTGVYYWVVKVLERPPFFDPDKESSIDFTKDYFRGFVHVYNTEE